MRKVLINNMYVFLGRDGIQTRNIVIYINIMFDMFVFKRLKVILNNDYRYLPVYIYF